MTFASLVHLMPPPANPVEVHGSWFRAETTLGARLPDDFKDFIRVYGSGKIANFLSILNPFSLRPTLNLLEQSKRQLQVLRELETDFGEENPFELFPTPGGLLPVALTDNGDVVHWLTQGSASEWTIVVNEARSPDFEQFNSNLTTFLRKIVDNSTQCRAFPKSAFLENSQFFPI